jgi:protein-S-isoprenylcysteine O-methyltransferase Ste14
MKHPESVSALQITPAWLIGCALMASGAYIRYSCYRELGRFFTWELSMKKDQNLVTTGPYSYVRHPSYAGTLLATVGTFICQLSPGTWMAESGWFESTGVRVAYALWLAYQAYIPYMMLHRTNVEDQMLRNNFPEEWKRWARQTPYKMIPYVF